MGRKTHVSYLKEFKTELEKKIPIQKMILFGSRVKGKAHRWSDFDLLIVSPSFKRKKSFKRALGFRKYWVLDYPADFLCYTPEEFNKLKKQTTIVQDAVKNGREI